jgi:hypothetical protein
VKRILALLIPIALLGLVLVPSAEAARSQAMIFDGGGALIDDAGSREQTLDEIQSLGGREVRVLVTWLYVTPPSLQQLGTKPPGSIADPNSGLYDWGGWDGLVESLRRRGMKIHMAISGPVPRWATKARRDNRTEPRTDYYQQFAQAVARRYGRYRPVTWATWNEPNQNSFLLPQYRRGKPVSPKLYRNLHLAAVRGLRAGGVRNPKLLFGELAGRSRGAVPPLQFLRESLCLNSSYRRVGRCAKITVGGFAIHTYSTRGGPFQRPPKRDDVLINALPRLTTALDRSARAGRINRGLRVWITESGTVTRPRADGTTLDNQPIYNATMERIAYENSRVSAISQFLMRDPSTAANVGTFTTGLRTSRNVAKPGYEGWRMPLSGRVSGRRVSLWGKIRPTRRSTTVQIQRCDSRCTTSRARWTRLVNKRVPANGYFTTTTTFKRGRQYRLVWQQPGAGTRTGPPITPLVWARPVR